jgi:hypothetical protein
MTMSERPGPDLSGLEIDVVRRIDAACRRFEADWRGGRQPRVLDYLDDFPEEGRAALRWDQRPCRSKGAS